MWRSVRTIWWPLESKAVECDVIEFPACDLAEEVVAVAGRNGGGDYGFADRLAPVLQAQAGRHRRGPQAPRRPSFRIPRRIWPAGIPCKLLIFKGVTFRP